MKDENKTCGNCQNYKDGWCIYSDDPFEVEKDSIYCADEFFKPKRPTTNGDAIRQGGDKALAEISIYEKQLADGVKVYRSTLIEEKYWLSRACAIGYVEQTLGAPAESEAKDE